ncbi:DUF2158 domain-containing protein [bacterium]|nr:MAG: DUF2158 domain-containing protein [bacterium]
MSEFKVGDIVRLKSGGPDMTIESTNSLYSGDYDCQWFAGKKLETGSFKEETLIAVDSKETNGTKAK